MFTSGHEVSGETKLKDRAEVEAHLAAGKPLRGLDLSGVDLRGLDLSARDLTAARLRYADLSGCNLQGAIMRGANLRHARLAGADLRYADLSAADLGESDMHGVKLGETRLEGARAEKARGVSEKAFFPLPMHQILLQKTGVSFSGGELRLPGPPIEVWALVPACRVLEADGSVRGPSLVGRVLTVDEVKARGGEVDEGFLLLDGTSWRVEGGWLGTPVAASTAKPTPPEDSGKSGSSKPDTSMLEDFLLGKLS